MYKVLATIIAIFITNTALALDAEYKNTLTKIDLSKSSESSYNIDLYTAKDYKEPVKVVKKSDLNYYILLPETNNTLQNIKASNIDIRSIETQLFPYAGSDVKNGYTKININTKKPINFSVSTKTLSASTPQKTIAQEVVNQEVGSTEVETKAQKKNLAQEVQKPKDNNVDKQNTKIAQKKVEAPKKEAQPVKKNVQPNVNKTSMAAAKMQDTKSANKKTETKKPEVKKTEVVKKVENKNPEPIEAKKIETPKVEMQPVQPIEPIAVEQVVQEESNEIFNEVDKAFEEKEEVQEVLKEDTKEIEEPKNDISKSFNFILLKNKIQNKLYEYGLSFREFLLMIFAGLLSFIIMLLILTKGKDVDTRLKSKADFIDKTSNKNSTLVPKKNKQNKKANNYFIFDKNVRQTGLIPPASEGRKNYELSSYEPYIQNKTTAVVEPYQAKHVTSEYDIIRNILKEDAFIELSNDELTESKEQTNPVTSEKKELSEIIAPKPTAMVEPEEKDEPEILSSVEIAPQRGFMCVSYNNTISLVGYIFDDVFALYNFQQAKLENYNIQFRLSEKTPNGANFIVRIDKMKMLISATKSSMNLEVAY